MAVGRLTLALEAGAVHLPDGGPIAVVGASSAQDLSAIPLERLRLQVSFRPDFDAWYARGVDVSTDSPSGEAAVVFLSRSRTETMDRLHRALSAVPVGAPVIVDGQKDAGIDSVLKAVRTCFEVREVFAKSHGKCFAIAAAPPPADWAATPTRTPEGFVTVPAAFSADRVDPGSAALAAALPPLSGRVVDLGAGWGYLSHEALKHPAVTSVDLVEAEHSALEAARANIDDPRARFHWADATRFVAEQSYDVVLSNPPFHTGRRAEPALGQAFIEAAGRLTARGGAFFMVANRHLPYEATLRATFAEVHELSGPPAFKVLRATHPRRSRAKRVR